MSLTKYFHSMNAERYVFLLTNKFGLYDRGEKIGQLVGVYYARNKYYKVYKLKNKLYKYFSESTDEIGATVLIKNYGDVA